MSYCANLLYTSLKNPLEVINELVNTILSQMGKPQESKKPWFRQGLRICKNLPTNQMNLDSLETTDISFLAV